jgi:thiamine-phosphate diphosphorylase
MAAAKLQLPCLMVLCETTAPSGGSIERIVIGALDGGATAVQLRDKMTLPEELKLAALELRDVTRGRATFVINDAPEIAIELRLDGVHLPEAAFDIDRTSIGWPFVVGRSVHNVECAVRAQEAGCNYIVAGNVFETDSHPGKDGQGIAFLAAVCRAVTIPVLAIGGISPANVPECIAAGASGVVVRSGIVNSSNPIAAAEGYWGALNSARSGN